MRAIRAARWDRGRTPYVVTAAVLTVAALAEAATGAVAPDGAGRVDAVDVAAAVALGAAVLLAAWAPLAAVLLLALSVAVPPFFVDLPAFGGAHLIASMLLVGHASYRCSVRRGLAAYVVSVLVPATTIVLVGESVWEFAFYTLVLAPAWAVGLLLRRERQRSAQLQRLAAELRAERERSAAVAVAEERTRISRELHDAVAHTVSVMTLQVGVVRRRLGVREDATTEAETLAQAEGLGRQAVDELRRIVGLVRAGEEAALAPLPSLARLEELLEPLRGGGTDVRAAVGGDLGALPQAVDVSAYRILQEGLTNALRHAPGAGVDVRVEAGPDVLVLEVVNGPATRPPAPTAAGGHGLVGMRERASLLGGRLEAGADGDGYAVRAVLPLAAPARQVGEPA